MYDFFDERKCFSNIEVGHITELIFCFFHIIDKKISEGEIM